MKWRSQSAGLAARSPQAFACSCATFLLLLLLALSLGYCAVLDTIDGVVPCCRDGRNVLHYLAANDSSQNEAIVKFLLNSGVVVVVV